MSGTLYFKCDVSLRSNTAIRTKIEQLDALIDSLLTTAMTSVSNGNIAEYEIDTGQTRNRVKYSTTDQVVESLRLYENMRQFYANKLTSGVVRLVDSKNFRG